MGGLSHYIEREGVPTVQISLVREHTEKIRPPRALWVPFAMGRPLGAPGDTALQHRVLRATLALVEEPSGPVLVDFPDDAPGAADLTSWICPIPLARASAEGGSDLEAELEDEIARLRPWYERALENRGRTAFGILGIPIEEVVHYLLSQLGDAARSSPRPGIADGDAVVFASEDLKTYYTEAATAEPAGATSRDLLRWLVEETAAGRLLLALQERELIDGL